MPFLDRTRHGDDIESRDPFIVASLVARRRNGNSPSLLPKPPAAQSRLTRLLERAKVAAAGRFLEPRRSCLLEEVLSGLRRGDPNVYAERADELALLADVLVAVPQDEGHRLRPVEALESVLAIANLGLELRIETGQRHSDEDTWKAASGLVASIEADMLFQRGY